MHSLLNYTDHFLLPTYTQLSLPLLHTDIITSLAHRYHYLSCTQISLPLLHTDIITSLAHRYHYLSCTQISLPLLHTVIITSLAHRYHYLSCTQLSLPLLHSSAMLVSNVSHSDRHNKNQEEEKENGHAH